MGKPTRWFIGAATTIYLPESGLDDRPELASEVERMAKLFVGLGYQRVPGFGVNLSAVEFQNELRQFLISPQRCDDDVVAIYYTGHGIVDQGNLLLPMADTTADVAYTAMPAAELTGKVLSGPVVVRRLLFILDSCYAAAAGRAMTGGAIDFVNRLRGLAALPTVAIVVAARPNEQARAGAFAQAFVDAVGHRSSGGHEPEFLALDGLVNIVNDTTPEWQHARLFLTGDAITEFVPNPRLDRWLRDLDLRTQALHRLRAIRRAEQHDHVLPRAQGLDTATSGEDLWLFTGRHQALREVSNWLRSPAGPATMVVTGDPGSGKSAVLSRLFVLADRKLRNRVPRLHTLPEGTVPPLGAVNRFIHARGLTIDELMAGICEACNVEETVSPGGLLASVAGPGEQVVVIVDAIDEAAASRTAQSRGEFPIVDQALAPLVRSAARTRLRLLLATRRHLLPALGGPVQLVDLDTSMYADAPSVSAYARSCLVDLSDESPYRNQPLAYLKAVASAIAEAAGNSFLVALITARSLALRGELADPANRAWRVGLPRLATDAMRDDLDGRLGTLAAQARELLLPLAYAQGSGLPWEDVWPLLARALTAAPYTSGSFDWLIEAAGFYIVESTSDDGRRSTYRLFHEALAEHLRACRDDPSADQATIVDALTGHSPRLADGRPDWDNAHPYIRANLSTHAAGTDRLDPLATDPRFLLAASRSPLLAALPSTQTAQARACADAYRRADSRLQTSPDQDRAAYLQLAARCARAPQLADIINTSDLTLTWVTDWASWRLQPPHRSFTGHVGAVHAVAIGRLEGRTVVVSGSEDETVRIWDAATGAPLGDPFTSHTDAVTAVAIGELEGRTVVVSGSEDETVRIWDAATGAPLGDPLPSHTSGVNAVAVAQPSGRTVMVSASDRTVRIWDAATAVPLGKPFAGHTDWVNAVAVGQFAGRTVVVSGSSDATVQVWDAATGTPLGDPFAGHTDAVNAVAIGELDGRTVVVSGSDDATVRVWDAATGAPAADPFTVHTEWVSTVAVGQVAGRAVVVSGSGDNTVRVWEPATGAPLGDPFIGNTGPVYAVAIAQLDGRTVVVSGSSDNTLRIWDAATGAPAADPFTGHTGPVYAVAIGRLEGGTVVVSGSSDNTVRVWDAATGAPLGDPFTGHSDWVRAVAVAELEGRTVVVSGSDDATVQVWDAATGAPLGDSFTGHSDWVNAVAVGELEGRTVVVSGSSDKRVRIWDAATGAQLGKPFTGHTDAVNAVTVAQLGGHTVVVSGSNDATVRVWDAATGAQQGDPFTGHTDTVNAVAVAELDGRTVVVSGSSDKTVRVWDAATGAQQGDPFTGHTDTVNAVAIGKLGGRTVVVSGSSDKTVRVWDAATGISVGDLSWRHGKAGVSSSKIDLAASTLGIASVASSRFVIATELGIVSLRMPMLS